MKRYFFFTIFLFMVTHLCAQYNENAPWMKNLNQNKSALSKTEFSDISDAFNLYWEDRDWQKKGSGFKPFKRWENHWKHYLLSDGTIATPDMIWRAWEAKKNMANSKSNTSNWSSLGPYTTNLKSGQGRINTFIIDPNNPNVFYVGAPSGGIWKSTDFGTNWTPMSDQIPQIGVSGIAIDPNNSNVIYIATGDDDARDTYSIGVLKSTDGGTTWNKTGLDFTTTNSSSSEVYINPTNSDIVWAATSKGLYRSLDAGVTFLKKQQGNFLDFKFKPGDPNTIYGVTGKRFYKSVDGGESFELIGSNLPVETTSSRMAVEVTEANPEVVYVLSANNENEFNGVYKSTDSGTTFTKTAQVDNFFDSSQAWYDMALTVSPVDENMIFIGEIAVWKSTDGGDSFQRKTFGYTNEPVANIHVDQHFLRFFNNKLYVGNDGGIYESSDDGENYNDLTENLNISQYYRIATGKNSISNIAGGLQDNGGFGYSNNIWHEYHSGDGMDCAVNPNDANIYYGFSQYGGQLSVTYDGGPTGKFLVTAPSDETDGANDLGGKWVTPLVMNNEGTLYSGYSKLYNLNNSNVWEAVSSDAFGGDLDHIAISHSDNQVIYVSRSNKLFKSIDGGATFEELTFFFANTISSVEINNQNSDIVYVTNSGFNGDIYQSIDAGENWTSILKNLPSEPKYVIKHQNQSQINDLYLGTSLGVYHINDNMTEWEVYDTNLPNVPIRDIEINPEEATITVGTYGRGVWQSPIEVSKVANDVSLIALNSHKSVQCEGVTPIITVRNNGTNAINQIDINYMIDDEMFNYSFNGAVASGELKRIELPNNNSVDFGEHTIDIEATIVNDAFFNNNSLYGSFQTNQAGEGQYINTFGEVNDDEWLTPTGLWQKGIASTTLFQDKFDNSYTTNLIRNYTDETTSYLISPCYDLTKLVNPIIKFDMVFDIELDWDVLYVEYTIDNGENWSILGTASDPNWYNSDFIDPQRPITVGKQWTGTDTDVKEYSYNLSALNAETSIIFRFVFRSDAAENGEGASIDNFTIDASSIILAVDDIDDNHFLIYPNPASSQINIRRPFGDEMRVAVYDVTGKMIYTDKNILNSNYILNLPQNISKGIYFLRISEGNFQITKQLMVD